MKTVKVLLVMVGIIFVFANGTKVMAYDGGGNTVSPYYVNIQNCDTSFQISEGKAICEGSIVGKKGKECRVEITLQQKKGSSWTKVEKWSKTGTTTCYLSKTYSISKGYSYRIKVYYECGSENLTEYSTVKNYL